MQSRTTDSRAARSGARRRATVVDASVAEESWGCSLGGNLDAVVVAAGAGASVASNRTNARSAGARHGAQSRTEPGSCGARRQCSALTRSGCGRRRAALAAARPPAKGCRRYARRTTAARASHTHRLGSTTALLAEPAERSRGGPPAAQSGKAMPCSGTSDARGPARAVLALRPGSLGARMPKATGPRWARRWPACARDRGPTVAGCLVRVDWSGAGAEREASRATLPRERRPEW